MQPLKINGQNTQKRLPSVCVDISNVAEVTVILFPKGKIPTQ